MVSDFTMQQLRLIAKMPQEKIDEIKQMRINCDYTGLTRLIKDLDIHAKYFTTYSEEYIKGSNSLETMLKWTPYELIADPSKIEEVNEKRSGKTLLTPHGELFGLPHGTNVLMEYSLVDPKTLIASYPNILSAFVLDEENNERKVDFSAAKIVDSLALKESPSYMNHSFRNKFY